MHLNRQLVPVTIICQVGTRLLLEFIQDGFTLALLERRHCDVELFDGVLVGRGIGINPITNLVIFFALTFSAINGKQKLNSNQFIKEVSILTDLLVHDVAVYNRLYLIVQSPEGIDVVGID